MESKYCLASNSDNSNLKLCFVWIMTETVTGLMRQHTIIGPKEKDNRI